MPPAVGLKVTLMLQELPGDTEAGQKLWNEKSPGLGPLMVKLVMLSTERPTFVSVIVLVVELPTA